MTVTRPSSALNDETEPTRVHNAPGVDRHFGRHPRYNTRSPSPLQDSDESDYLPQQGEQGRGGDKWSGDVHEESPRARSEPTSSHFDMVYANMRNEEKWCLASTGACVEDRIYQAFRD